MEVKLISYTQTPDGKSIEEQIAYCARVSNPANQNNTETAPKLIEYLIRNKHWSPFEMASITLEIQTTRDIGRQILRHRSFSFQEFSQRYAVAPSTFETREARLQDTKNRQNSFDTKDQQLIEQWNKKQNSVIEAAGRAYQEAIDLGIAKEVARAVLPEGMTRSTMYMAGTIRSWIHYIELRTNIATQKEHRDVAVACAQEIETIFPLIYKFVGTK